MILTYFKQLFSLFYFWRIYQLRLISCDYNPTYSRIFLMHFDVEICEIIKQNIYLTFLSFNFSLK